MAPPTPPSRNPLRSTKVVTVTAVGKPGTQAWLSADTKPGDTNIKVSSVTNITAGDKIRLGYDTTGHGVEWVTVKNVGTQGFNPNNARTGNPGTGLDLVEPLKFHHSMNTPFSARGTGISFEPATAVAHSSNEPVLPLGTGITLDKPLDNGHDIDAVVQSPTGAQATPKPNQLFGGPALTNAGTIVLRDAPAWSPIASTSAASSTPGPQRVTKPHQGAVAAARLLLPGLVVVVVGAPPLIHLPLAHRRAAWAVPRTAPTPTPTAPISSGSPQPRALPTRDNADASGNEIGAITRAVFDNTNNAPWLDGGPRGFFFPVKKSRHGIERHRAITS